MRTLKGWLPYIAAYAAVTLIERRWKKRSFVVGGAE
jgi:hypothetical protein